MKGPVNRARSAGNIATAVFVGQKWLNISKFMWLDLIRCYICMKHRLHFLKKKYIKLFNGVSEPNEGVVIPAKVNIKFH